MDLDSLKYAELQRLAKAMGLKANMKADKLLKTIKQHYKETKEQSEQDVVKDVAAQDDANEDGAAAEEASTTVAFVNARRGKGAGNKRKTDASDSTEVAPSAPEMEAVARSKRSRVSAQTEDKNEAPTTSGNAPQVVTAGKIPRLQKKQMLKPVTPNFKKLHEAQFNKMESIDSYVQRKTKQMESYKNEVKELKMLSEQTKQQIRGKPEATQKSSRTCLFSPAPASKTQVEEKHRYTLLSASKVPAKKAADKKEEVPFRPTVLSTRRVNVRFSEATKDNEYKKSLVKTPARMSPCVASSTPLRKAEDVKPNSFKATTLSATKTGPFVFTGNTSTCTTPGTQKKSAFNLKASLARPLGYRPHKGKLKPFGETKENPAANMSLTLNSHQNYKQHQVQTREERRVIHTQDRKQKKNNLLGARRGLVLK